MTATGGYIPAPRLTLSDLRGATLHWILDLEWAGQSIHLTSHGEELAILVGSTGETRAYLPGLDFGGEVDDQLELLSDYPGPKSVDVSLLLPDSINVPLLHAQGHAIDTATGTLSVWVEGTNVVRPVMVGRMRNGTWDVPEEPVTGTLEEGIDDDTALWPPASYVIDATSWPNRDPDIDGEYPPVVFGSPVAVGTQNQAAPAVFVDTGATDYVCVSIGHVDASSVYIENVTNGNNAYKTVTHTHDGRGLAVSYCDVTSLASSSGDEFWVDWRNSSGDRQFGITVNGDPIKGAGDLLWWWMERSRMRWDRGRMAIVRDLANDYRIDGFAMAGQGSRFSPMAFIRDRIVPMLPISARSGPGGVYYQWWHYGATTADSVATLTEGENCSRLGAVELSSRDEVYNTLDLLFEPDRRRSAWGDRIALTGSPETLEDDPDAVSDVFLRSSWNRYGEHYGPTFEADLVTDKATARRILAWKARRFGSQFNSTRYLAEQEVAMRLEPGLPVTLTDTDRQLTARAAIVTSIPLNVSGLVAVGVSWPLIDWGTVA